MLKIRMLCWWIALLSGLVCSQLLYGLANPNSDNALFGKPLKEIRIRGVHFTEIEIISRELASKVGHPYLEENASKDFNRLDKLDLFSEVKIRPELHEGGVVLNVQVIEILQYLPFITYEVTDENGLAIGPGVQSVSLGGKDVFLTALARFGGATNVSLFLENPWFAGDHLSYRLEVNQRDRTNDLDDFNEISTEVLLRIGHYLGPHGRIGGFLNFESIKSDTPGRTLSDSNKDNVGTLGFFLGYDSRDLWSNPHTGWWNSIDIAKVGGFLGSDSDFWRLNLDVRRYIPLLSRHTIALFSLTSLSSGTVGEDIASWQDFHLGGTNTVRGWELDSRSGKNQMINTAEYRVTVLKPRVLSPFGLSFDVGLQLALFGDMGLAWSENDEFSLNNSIGSYGAGLRLLVPFVNMFRFDFAKGESGKSFTLRIGAFPKAVAQRLRVR